MRSHKIVTSRFSGLKVNWSTQVHHKTLCARVRVCTHVFIVTIGESFDIGGPPTSTPRRHTRQSHHAGLPTSRNSQRTSCFALSRETSRPAWRNDQLPPCRDRRAVSHRVVRLYPGSLLARADILLALHYSCLPHD